MRAPKELTPVFIHCCINIASKLPPLFGFSIFLFSLLSPPLSSHCLPLQPLRTHFHAIRCTLAPFTTFEKVWLVWRQTTASVPVIPHILAEHALTQASQAMNSQ
ncbi:hypothetical protein Sjap_008049 [Stephania japonica]|uniref:Uncharacterized protein n=1 Tax=Stephania japonica TaxID=461633 RepID=A0AAP0PE84_9MAGN